MSYIALANITLSSAQSSVTFGSIPTSVNGVALRDLVLVVEGTSSSGTNNMFTRFNGDTGSNYSSVFMGGDGGSTFSGTNTLIDNGAFNTNRAVTIVQVMDYRATDKHKTTLTRNSMAGAFVIAYAGRWANTGAITSWTLANTSGGVTFSSGTTFALYGIAG